jgi:hypothetical protein
MANNRQPTIKYTGPSSAVVFHGDECKLIQRIPHGSYQDVKTGEIFQSETFRPECDRYIGYWFQVLSADDDLFTAPASWFTGL